MPTFEYQATRSDGGVESGTVLGPSLESAVGDLSRRGLSVLRIGPAAFPGDPLTEQNLPIPSQPTEVPPARAEAISEGPPLDPRSYLATHVWGPVVGKVSLTNLAFFFRQLSTMLKAGVPFVQSLDTLSSQSRDPRFRSILTELRDHVKAGRPMSAGMQRYPEVFSPMMLSLVRSGEQSGSLDELLSQTANYIDQEIELRNLYRRVTIYPKIVLVASIIIVLGANSIIAAVAPGRTGLSSPLTTIATWVILGPILIGLFLFFRVGLSNPQLRQVWDRFLLAIPFLGGTLMRLSMAKFGRGFGALYRAGVPMSESVKLAADSCGNENLRAKMYDAVGKLEQGAPLTETLRETRAFSPIVLDMVQTGETTGNLDFMLDKMAEFYEDDGKTRAVQLGYATGVAVLLLVAAYVGYVVVQFWSGYFGGLQQAVG